MNRVSGDSGVSLIELLITIVLLAVIGSVITTTIVTGTHDQIRITSHSAEIAKMRTTLDRMMRQIRDGTVVTMTQTRAVVLVQVGAAAFKTYDYRVVANGTQSFLVQIVQPTNSAATPTPGTSPTQTTLLSHVVNSAVEPVFTPDAWLTYSPPSGVTASCVITGSNPQAYAPRCVGSVMVHLRDRVPNTNEVLDLRDDVAIRNQP